MNTYKRPLDENEQGDLFVGICFSLVIVVPIAVVFLRGC